MPIREIRVRLRIVVEKDEGTLHAYCPDLKGLHVEGTTDEELKENVRCAVMGYFESLLKHDDPIPVGVLESDNSYTVRQFIVRVIAPQLWEHFTSRKKESYIEEVALPLPA